MWNSSEKDKNMVVDAAEKSTGLMEEDKCGLYESSRTDSGFLSSANLTVSSDQLLSEEIKSAPDSGLIEEDDIEQSMRLDSGVDLGLSETFSGLSLKSPSLNNLNSTKLRTNDDIPHVQTNVSSEEERPPWELYYRQDEEGDTQLHIAIFHGFIEVVYSLVRLAPHPCLLDIVNDRSQTPLHLAVLTRQPRVARRLVASGACPRARDLCGNTPLHLACATGDLTAVRELTAPVTIQEVEALGLSYGAVAKNEIDLEQRNYDGQMCVHLAALGGYVDILRHLVWLGANINAREGKSGYTPLHQAIENGDQATTHFLLTECAGQLQLEAPTYAGRTAVQLARGSTFVQALVSRGASVPIDDDTDGDYDTDSSEDMLYETSNVFKSGFAINASA